MNELKNNFKESIKNIKKEDLYFISKLLSLMNKGTELIIKNEAVQYAFKYGQIVDYSEKKFECTQAIAAKVFFDLQDNTKKEELYIFLEQLQQELNQLNIILGEKNV